ncbi:MAG: glycosyltransferase, partial [Candidatus Adiutricales bacterium]
NSPVNDKIIVLRGQFPQHTFDTIISASDVVGLPYETGGQSGIMAHCYAFNKPIVTSNLESFKKSIEQSGGGLICESDEDFINSIAKIIKDKNLRRKFQDNIKHYVENQVSWQIVAEAHINVYQKVVKVLYGKAKYVYWEDDE